MKLPSLFKIQESSFSPLPPCGNLKTLSFRVENNHNIFSSEFFYNNVDDYIVEAVIEGLKKEKQRLFFEPGEKTSSILEVSSSTKNNSNSNGLEFLPFNDSCVITTMDSMDPFEDFKRSMEEMVEANQEIKDCEKCLEELLSWYLKVNGKSNHHYIIGAFFDLLISYSTTSSSSSKNATTTTYSHSFTNSPFSFCSSSFSASPPCLSLLEAEDDEIVEKTVDSVSPSDV
ncbi:transcription repressor OFP13-like [Lycium barbarum]|uniref:transcription repressor OFP13-like n=1 Tax=Lycium barbarum TaxID=112863 RepID=UPI00293E033B|nr:transcription repressor OFP13-like [Lycium barbarum]